MQELTECIYTMQFTQCKTPQQNYTARQQLARNSLHMYCSLTVISELAAHKAQSLI